MLAGATVGALAWVRGAAHLSLVVVALISWMMSASGFRDGCRIGNIVTIRAQHSQSRSTDRCQSSYSQTAQLPMYLRITGRARGICLSRLSPCWERQAAILSPVSVKCHFAPVSDDPP